MKNKIPKTALPMVNRMITLWNDDQPKNWIPIWKAPANNRVKKATIRFSTGDSVELEFADSRGIQVRDIASVQTTFVTVVIDEVYPGSKYDDTSLAEIEVWGVTKEG